MNEQKFQLAIKYGGMLLLVCIISNIYLVMRHVELYRDAVRADAQFQQVATQQQAIQAVLQEFTARAAADPAIAEIIQGSLSTRPDDSKKGIAVTP